MFKEKRKGKTKIKFRAIRVFHHIMICHSTGYKMQFNRLWNAIQQIMKRRSWDNETSFMWLWNAIHEIMKRHSWDYETPFNEWVKMASCGQKGCQTQGESGGKLSFRRGWGGGGRGEGWGGKEREKMRMRTLETSPGWDIAHYLFSLDADDTTRKK